MSLELPRITLAQAGAAALALLGGVMAEAVFGRYPDAPAGLGAFAGAVTAVWLYLDGFRPSRALRRAVWLPDGSWRLEFKDGGNATASLGRGTRRIGRSLLLRWRLADGSVARWLTPCDIHDAVLRTVTVRLASAARLRGS
jgi:hypothetical protein